MKDLYHYVGCSRQAVSAARARQAHVQAAQQQTIELARQVRQEHSYMGLRDIWYTKRQQMPRGRDWTERLLAQCGFRRPPATVSYTKAGSRPEPNRIAGRTICRPHQLWQTDITYVWAGRRWYYASFVLDVYSRQVVGWQLSASLTAGPQVQLLQRCLGRLSPAQRKELIVHTDRGRQYTSHVFKKLMATNQVVHSMARFGWENAYIERLHRTIKHNYLKVRSYKTQQQLRQAIGRAVHLYNTEKPHRALPGRLAPEAFLAGLQASQTQDYEVKIWSELTHFSQLKIN